MRLEGETVAIFDLDDTLTDTTHRKILVDPPPGTPKDWGAFFSRSALDPERPWMLARALELATLGAHIVVFTGRPEHCRADSLAWLEARGVSPVLARFRGARDFRKSAAMKGQWLDELLAGGTRVLCAVDDEKTNLLLYSSRGLMSIDARDEASADGLFEAARAQLRAPAAPLSLAKPPRSR